MGSNKPDYVANLFSKAKAYCDAIDALLELDLATAATIDETVRKRLLATMQAADKTASELIDKLNTLQIDSGHLERMMDAKRTEPRMRRLPTEPQPGNHVPIVAAKLRDPLTCKICECEQRVNGSDYCVRCFSELSTVGMTPPRR